jgi:predicted transcriptional regulator
MTLQKRLLRVMRRRGWRVSELARQFNVPYMTMREWVLNGRTPQRYDIDKVLQALEK